MGETVVATLLIVPETVPTVAWGLLEYALQLLTMKHLDNILLKIERKL